ncbi:MAG: ABC-F family ATP-binding cassette domain-containing protein [Bacteroidales bacterium]|nr:ABC-F family ATP-binding cassette domain-containing protein [Bacteroidales bacterium]
MMFYLTVEGLTKYYGDFLLFDNVSFVVNRGEKTALVAKNGTGKSTLIRILLGNDTPQSGSVAFNKHITVGILEQDPEFNPNKTIFDEVYDAADAILDAIKLYNKSIEDTDQVAMQKAMELMDSLNAWDYETKVKQTLQVLKINDLTKKISMLSGGQKKRIALAKVLIKEPDFLILDEPTNHLDIEMIEWLEKYLKATSMTLLMVTHDRYFLDRVCDNIIEIDEAKIFSYKGNYSYFLQKRQERLEVLNAEISKAKNLFRHELEWIRRQPKARSTKAKYRVEAFKEISGKASQKISDKNVSINVEAQRLGNKIIEFSGLSKSFDDLVILDNFNYRFQKFEKVGIIGYNGSGKSTFLNILSGLIPSDSGDIEYGETLNIGYYRQDGLQFTENKKVIEVITDIASHIQLSKDLTISASQFLEHFLFKPSSQHNFVSKLSGGEKKRLYLMTVLMKQPNFLILDEPTNDLDIQTLQILEQYLQDFSGCLILVSHDRFFTDKLVEHLFIFEGNGVIKDFPGNYSDYRDWKIENDKNQDVQNKSGNKAVIISSESKPVKKKLSFKEQSELNQLEKDIANFTTKKLEIEAQLSTGTLSSEVIQKNAVEIAEIIEKLDEMEMRWLELQDDL